MAKYYTTFFVETIGDCKEQHTTLNEIEVELNYGSDYANRQLSMFEYFKTQQFLLDKYLS